MASDGPAVINESLDRLPGHINTVVSTSITISWNGIYSLMVG